MHSGESCYNFNKIVPLHVYDNGVAKLFSTKLKTNFFEEKTIHNKKNFKNDWKKFAKLTDSRVQFVEMQNLQKNQKNLREKVGG